MGADDAADDQQQGQHDIDGIVRRGVQHRGVGRDKDDLEQRSADHDFGRHAQQIDHGRHHDEPAADAHNCGQDADQNADQQGRDDRNIKARDAKLDLERQIVDPVVMLARLACAGLARFQDRVQAFHQHQRADDAKEDDVEQADQQINLAKAAQVVEDQQGKPTYGIDLARTVLKLISNNTIYTFPILHYANHGVCSWKEFAEAIVNELECKTIVQGTTTLAYPTSAIRPKYSVLNIEKAKEVFNIQPPNWEISLKKVIKNI